MKKYILLNCPFCNGTGELKITKNPRKIAKELLNKRIIGKSLSYLQEQGLSLREIGKIAGIKSAETVRYYIEKYSK